MFFNGPTIEVLAVKKPYRGQSIGKAFIHWLVRILNSFVLFILHLTLIVIKLDNYLKFWKPAAGCIYLYASFITNGHQFFEKMGFSFYDQFNEEACKRFVRVTTRQLTSISNSDPNLSKHRELS